MNVSPHWFKDVQGSAGAYIVMLDRLRLPKFEGIRSRLSCWCEPLERIADLNFDLEAAEHDIALRSDSRHMCCFSPAHHDGAYSMPMVGHKCSLELSDNGQVLSESYAHHPAGIYDRTPGLESAEGHHCPPQEPHRETCNEKNGESNLKVLEDAVLIFWVNAVQGCPCTYLGDSSAERTPAKLYIDRLATNLIVRVGEDYSNVAFQCALGSVLKISIPTGRGDECFPSDIWNSLTPTELNLLVQIFCSDSQETRSLRLIAESLDARNGFMTCLPVLGLYAKKIEESVQAKSQRLREL